MKQFNIPSGFKDYILGECESKKILQKKIETVLDKWGYKEIITPTIEYYDTYLTGFDEVKEEDMFKLISNSGKTVTLRADMTVPIARVAATKFKDSKKPLRFRYCASVYKNNKELSGLVNELTDCGVELIGVDESCGDLEILVSAIESLKVINKEFTLEIGNVNFFKEACNDMKLDKQVINDLSKLIGNRNLVELDEYLLNLDLNNTYKEFFRKLPWMNGDEQILNDVKDLAFNNKLKAIIDNVSTLCNELKSLGYTNEFSFDFAKLNNLEYYTGLIFEAYFEGVGSKVLSGGRYDNLIGKFGDDLPAVGFSIKLDYLIDSKINDNQKIIIEYPSNLKVEAIKKARVLQENNVVELVNNNDIETIQIDNEVKL